MRCTSWFLTWIFLVSLPVVANADEPMVFMGGGPVMHFGANTLEVGVEASVVLIPDYDSDLHTLLPLWANAGLRRGANRGTSSLFGEVGVWFGGLLGVGVDAKFGAGGGTRISFMRGLPLPLFFQEDHLIVVAMPHWRSFYDLRDGAWSEEFGLSLKVMF